METPPFNPQPTRMMTRSVLAEIPTRLGRLSMTDPNNGKYIINTGAIGTYLKINLFYNPYKYTILPSFIRVGSK